MLGLSGRDGSAARGMRWLLLLASALLLVQTVVALRVVDERGVEQRVSYTSPFAVGALDSESVALRAPSSEADNAARDLQTITTVYWKLFPWTSCTVPCGGGTQRRDVICTSNVTQREVDEARCDPPRPKKIQVCNTQQCPAVEVPEFSCDPRTGYKRCSGMYRGGGRLHIRVLAARLLPNFDDTPLSGVTDPYVRVTIGGVTRVTQIKRNTLNPVWGDADGDARGETLFFGIRDSAEAMRIEVWDSDGGFEGADDHIATVDTAVLACSMYSDFCNERTWLPLVDNALCYFNNNASQPNGAVPCIRIEQSMTPYAVAVEEKFTQNNVSLDMANDWAAPDEFGGDLYAERGLKVDASFQPFHPARQGTIVRLSTYDVAWNTSAIATLSTNYRCNVYLFRYALDGTIDTVQPAWLMGPHSRWIATEGLTAVRARIMGSTLPDGQFLAHRTFIPAFSTITLGGLFDGQNTTNLNASFLPAYNYFAVFKAVVDDPPIIIKPVKPFDRAEFVRLFWQFAIPELLLLLFVVPFCWSIRFRLDLIEPYLATRVLPPVQRHGLAKAAAKHIHGEMAYHLIAAALLDHPDTLRAENARRLKARQDVAAYCGVEGDGQFETKAEVDARVRAFDAAAAKGPSQSEEAEEEGGESRAEEDASPVEAEADAGHGQSHESADGDKDAAAHKKASTPPPSLNRPLRKSGPGPAGGTAAEEDDTGLSLRGNGARSMLEAAAQGKGKLQRGGSPAKGPARRVEDIDPGLSVPPIIHVGDSLATWHRNLFWTTALVKLLLVAPPIINAAHGIVLMMTLQPPAMGVAVLFCGTAAYAALWGLGQWAAGGYRPSRTTALCLVAAVACLLLFLIIAAVWDPLPLEVNNITAVTGLVTFLLISSVAFMNTEALKDAYLNIAGMSKVLRVEEEAEAAAIKKEMELQAEAERGKAGKKPGMSLEQRLARKRAKEATIDLAGALGVPADSAPAIGSVLSQSALICFDVAQAGGPAVAPDSSSDPAAEGGSALGSSVLGSAISSPAGGGAGAGGSVVGSPAGAATVQKMRKSRAEARAAQRASEKAGKELFGGGGGGDDWDDEYKRQLAQADAQVQAQNRRREEEARERRAAEEKARIEAFIAEWAVKEAKEMNNAVKRRMAEAGVSLGLNDQEDAVLRLAAVASAPWLQPQGDDGMEPFWRRSPTHVLGSLLGWRVFSLLHAPPTGELAGADGLNGIFAAHPLATRRNTRLAMLLDFLLLAAHAVFVALAFPEYRYDGLATAVSLGLQDYISYRLIKGYLLNRGPVYFSLLSAAARACIAWYAGRQWIVGHAFAYLVWGVALGYESAVHRLPAISRDAAEFICYLAQFDPGEEYSTAVRRANAIAASFQREVARFFGIDLNKTAEQEAADKKAALRAKLRKRRTGDDDEDEEGKDKDDPYSVDAIRKRDADAKAAAASKTPLASRYAVKAADGEAASSSVGRKEESKVIRNSAARMLKGGTQPKKEAKPTLSEQKERLQKAQASGAARRAAEEAAAVPAHVDTPVAGPVSNGAAMPNKLNVDTTVVGGNGTPGSGGSGGSAAPNLSVAALAAKKHASKKNKYDDGIFSSLTQLEEPWSAFLVYNLAFLAALLPYAIYIEIHIAELARIPPIPAGLFDSSRAYPVPLMSLFGADTKTWLAGLAALATVWIFTLFAATASAFNLRQSGMLPRSFDILLPLVTKKHREIHRVPYPHFLAALTQAISVAFGLAFYFLADAPAVLLFSIFLVPCTVLVGLVVARFISNGYSFITQGRLRQRLTREFLFKLNELAGNPMSDARWMDRWRYKMSPREKAILDTIEHGESGLEPSAFERFGKQDSYDVTGLTNMLSKKGNSGDDDSKKKASAAARFGAAAPAASGGDGEEPQDPEAAAAAAEDAELKKDDEELEQIQRGCCGALRAELRRRYYLWKLKKIDIERMSTLSAYFRGYLTPEDTAAVRNILLLSGLFLLLGILAASILSDPVIGYSIWLVPVILVTSLPPVLTYTTTLKWTRDLLLPFITSMLVSAVMGGMFATSSFLVNGADERLAYMITAFLTYYSVLFGIIGKEKWVRSGYKHTTTTAVCFVILTAALVGFTVVMYVWAAPNVAVVVALSSLLMGVAGIAIQIWANHAGYLPPFYQRLLYGLVAGGAIAATVAALLIEYVDLFLGVSIAFSLLLLWHGTRAVLRFKQLTDDTPLVCGPLIFPLYTYNVDTGQPTDETVFGLDVARSLLLLLGWGVFAICFIAPLFTGILMSCGAVALAFIVACRAAIHTPISVGSFAPYIDTEAVRGARTLATDALFARRNLVPAAAMLDTSTGAGIVDAFANHQTKHKKDKPAAGGAGAGDSTAAQEEEDGTLDTARSDAVDGDGNKLTGTAAAAAKAHHRDADPAAQMIDKELSFLDPATRKNKWYEGVARKDCASTMSAAAVTRWALSSAWPWQIPDAQWNRELYELLLMKLHVAAADVVEKYEAYEISLRQGCSGACRTPQEQRQILDGYLRKIVRRHVNEVVSDMCDMRWLGDGNAIAEHFENEALVVPPLEEAMTALFTNIRNRQAADAVANLGFDMTAAGPELAATVAAILARVRGHGGRGGSQRGGSMRNMGGGSMRSMGSSMSNLPVSPGAGGGAGGDGSLSPRSAPRTPRSPAAAAAAAVSPVPGSPMARQGSMRAVSANASTRNLHSALGGDSDRESVDSGSAGAASQRSVSVGAGGIKASARGNAMRSLEKISREASFKAAGSGGPKASVGVSGRRAGKKGGGGGDKPKAAAASASAGAVGSSELVRKREKLSLYETLRRGLTGWIDFFFRVPDDVIPPYTVPRWQTIYMQDAEHASIDYRRAQGKKAVLYHALQSHTNYVDTAQLTSLLVHPLYEPVPRADRGWSWADAITDAFVAGRGPLGFIVGYGAVNDLFRAVVAGLTRLCCASRTRPLIRTYSPHDTIGCCGRRARLHPASVIPTAKQPTPFAAAVAAFNADSQSHGQGGHGGHGHGGGAHHVAPEEDPDNFPPADKVLSTDAEGNVTLQQPTDLHGLAHAANSCVYGVLTVAGTGYGTTDAATSNTAANAAPQAGKLTATVGSPTGAPKDAADPENASSASETEGAAKARSPLPPPPRPFLARKNNGSPGSLAAPPPAINTGAAATATPTVMPPPKRAAQPVSLLVLYQRLLSAQQEIGIEFYEEVRALLHFQMLLATYGVARRQVQRARFPYFFDMARTYLSAQGVHVPEAASDSALGTDVMRTACWISLLDERGKRAYATAKMSFDAQMKTYTKAQLANYKALLLAAAHRRQELHKRGDDVVKKHLADCARVSRVLSEQRTAGRQAAKGGISTRALAVHASHMENVVLVDEVMLGKVLVHDIERNFKGCKPLPGRNKRRMQFTDAAFAPGNEHLGELHPKRVADTVANAWKPAVVLNSDIQVFRGGSDPDDVNQGYAIRDGWLTSGICMLAASGGIGDEGVDPLLDALFIVKRLSDTGVYALRLYVNGRWVTVLVDDQVPVLLDGHKNEWIRKTPKCRTVGVTHSSDFAELWPTLLEKAMAKVYGSYAQLNRGFLEHALEAFTGATTQRIPVQVMSDGPYRSRLWLDMVRFVERCKYMVGAETFGGNFGGAGDHELLPNGLAGSSIYLVYEAREVDGARLIRLREPPGVTSAWKGAYSATSTSWTNRMIADLKWSADKDRRDKTLWMCFDDFCANFQSLYVCRITDPRRWQRRQFAGAWVGATAAGLAAHEGAPPANIHMNPQYTLNVEQPCTVCITLMQFPALFNTHKHGTPGSSGSAAYGGSHGGSHGGDSRHSASSADSTSTHGLAVRDWQPVSLLLVSRAGEQATRMDAAHYSRGDADVHRLAQPGGHGASRAAIRPGMLSLLARSSSRRIIASIGSDTEGQEVGAAAAEDTRTALELQQVHSCLGAEVGSHASVWDTGAQNPVLNQADGRVYALTSSNLVATSGAPTRQEQTHLYANLQPGRYVIVAATAHPGQEGGFGVSVESTAAVAVRQLWPPDPRKAAGSQADKQPKRRAGMAAVSENNNEDTPVTFRHALESAVSGWMTSLAQKLGVLDGTGAQHAVVSRHAEVDAVAETSDEWADSREHNLVQLAALSKQGSGGAASMSSLDAGKDETTLMRAYDLPIFRHFDPKAKPGDVVLNMADASELAAARELEEFNRSLRGEGGAGAGAGGESARRRSKGRKGSPRRGKSKERERDGGSGKKKRGKRRKKNQVVPMDGEQEGAAGGAGGAGGGGGETEYEGEGEGEGDGEEGGEEGGAGSDEEGGPDAGDAPGTERDT